MTEFEKALLSHQDAFVGFARTRINDSHLAADVVQDSLLKALQAESKPPVEKVVPWFYQILRRSIIDTYRRNDVRSRAVEKLQSELAPEPSEEDERLLCHCFRKLLPNLPEQYRSLIERIDLDGESPAAVAESLNITPNNLNVRLYRARTHLRKLLQETCRVCSTHGCLDCTCKRG